MAKVLCAALLPLALALAAASLPVQAQTAPGAAAVAQRSGEIARPDLPGAIPLRPAIKGAPMEQWETRGEQGRAVRNVVDPVLIPVLPSPDKATGAAMIVAPGGGFRFLSIDNEGFRVAQFLAQHGIAAFVLKYRTVPVPRELAAYQTEMSRVMSTRPDDPTPEATPEATADAQAAIRLVRSRAGDWGIDPGRVGFVGFSAGAMTALAVGLAPDKAARPDFIAPIYGPVWTRPVPADAPPMFLALALDDPLFATGQPLPLIQAWRHAGRPIEVHLYGRGGHGFGMTASTAAARMWSDQMLAWMRDMGLLRKPGEPAFSSAATPLGDLLDNPATRAIVERWLPQAVAITQMPMSRGMTLRQLQGYAPQMFTAEALARLNAELARVK